METLYGDRLVRLVLYGSHARGEAHDASGVDVLVVLDGPVQPGREIRRMRKVRTRLGLQYERALSLLPVAEADYQRRSSLQNVRQEGVAL